MNARQYIREYPNARPSTIAHLIERERLHKQLRAEIQKLRRKERMDRLKRVLMPWRQ